MRGALISAADALDRTSTRIKRRSDRKKRVSNVTLGELEARNWSGARPVFVLSTGRTGTKLFSDILEQTGEADVHHAPRPELVRVSKRAWEEIGSNPELFEEVVKTAREELIVEALRYGHTFVETNNRITFLAPAVATVFPESAFIHVVRHPADFVRSGIRRGWYEGSHAHDVGRIRPISGPLAESFDSLDQIAKIGWLWNETNQFIENFLATIHDGRILRTTSEKLFSDPAEVEQLLRFCCVQPPSRASIAARLARPVNAQSSGSFPKFSEWSEEQRSLLRNACPLAAKYGYEL
jgi:hypothetical protein